MERRVKRDFLSLVVAAAVVVPLVGFGDGNRNKKKS